MSGIPKPAKEAIDDLIRRLEEDLAYQNARLMNVRDPNGTLAKYLQDRIRNLGMELAKRRKERISFYGPFEENQEVRSFRDYNPKKPRLATNRVDGKRTSNKGRSSRKH